MTSLFAYASSLSIVAHETAVGTGCVWVVSGVPSSPLPEVGGATLQAVSMRVAVAIAAAQKARNRKIRKVDTPARG